MNDRFLIQLGKSMARNEQTMKAVVRAVRSNTKSIGFLGLGMGLIVIMDVMRDKEITQLKKKIKDLESKIKEKDEIDLDDILK